MVVMATNTPGTQGFIDSVLLGTVHMNIKNGATSDIIDTVVASFTEAEILSAKTELIQFLGMVVPSGHNDTAERTAAFLYTKELVSLVQELDKDNRMPRVVVSSDQLNRIPLGKKGLSPTEAVPISARMNDLEDTVRKLCESFDKFNSDNRAAVPPAVTFAHVARANHLGAVQRRPAHTMAGGPRQGVPIVAVTGPPQPGQQTWPGIMDQADHSKYGQGGYLGAGQERGRSVSPKRRREDSDNDGAGGVPFQTIQRKPRKVTYGKSQVTMDGAEAAPIDIFIGNTNPRATPQIIEAVMKKCAGELPEKVELQVLEVKCLNNLEVDPNPRTRCWKISVPYKFRELMAKDELYPAGWSHRHLFPPRPKRLQQDQKRPAVTDPCADFLSGGSTAQ